MTTLLATVFVLGLLIFIHELGHFLMAKQVGVRVERFSLGFGPKVVGFTRGETEYRLSAIPLGGYVKMSGEEPGEDVKGEPWEFPQRTVWERIRIVAAGPVMNIILAYVLIALVFFIGRQVSAYLLEAPVISWVGENSPASKAGFKVGDRIMLVNRHKVDTWEEAYMEMSPSVDKAVNVEVERAGQPVQIEFKGENIPGTDAGFMGLSHYIPAEVGALTQNYPAQKAGLQIGDRITKINQQPVQHWLELSQMIHRMAGQDIKLTVDRHGETLIVPIMPMEDKSLGIGLIGIQPPQKTVQKSYDITGSIRHGVREVHNLFTINATFLGQLISGKASRKNLGGPIAIAEIAGSAAESGISNLLWFTGMLSLQLGVLNLFPIPILDGGLIFFLIIEGILRRPISLKKRELAQNIGLAMVGLLMLLALYNDIERLILRIMG